MPYDFGNKDLGALTEAIYALGTNVKFNNQSIVKITSITPAVLNALANNTDTFTITVANAITEGKYFSKSLSYTKTALVSDTELQLVIQSVTASVLADNKKPVNDQGVMQEFDPVTALDSTTNNINVVNDIIISIRMSDVNAQDWLTGEVDIYIVLIDFPNPNDLPL